VKAGAVAGRFYTDNVQSLCMRLTEGYRFLSTQNTYLHFGLCTGVSR